MTRSVALTRQDPPVHWYHCQVGGEETQCFYKDDAFCAIPHDTHSHRLRRRKLFGGVKEVDGVLYWGIE